MSCKLLSETYSKETNIAIPTSDNALNDNDIKIKQEFLLTQTKQCLKNGKLTEDCGDANTEKTALPKNIFVEEGFLNWVNMKGSHCINQVMGKFVGFETVGIGDDQTLIYMEPGEVYPEPKGHCTSACFDFTVDSETCFQCVKEVVEDKNQNPVLYSKQGETGTPIQIDLCSEGYQDKTTGVFTVDTDMMKSAVGCKTCLGNNMTNLTEPSKDDPNVIVYQIDGFNNMWGCISGNIPKQPLSTSEIVYIVVGVIVFLAIVIGLSVYLSSQKRKQNVSTTNTKILLANKQIFI
jgi:hypothetical protein